MQVDIQEPTAARAVPRAHAPPAGPVTIFLPTLRGGGTERVMVTLANQLARRSVELELLLLSGEGVFFDELDPDVAVHLLDVRPSYSSVLGIRGYWRYLRRSKPRLVVISGHSAFLVGFLVSLWVPHKIIVVVHNTVSRERRLSSLIAKFLYRFAHRIVAVSHGVAKDLSAYSCIELERIQVIYNAVDLTRIDRALQAPPAHPWLEDPAVPVVVSVGRLIPQKRVDLLLRAIARVRAKRPVRLIQLGDGPLRHELEALAQELGIAEDVCFAGFVKNPYAYLRDASVFALASDFEGFAVVVIEALACGCPVVSTSCPSGPDEILEGGRWGTLVPTGDVEALASALDQTLTAPPPRRHARGRAEDFSAEGYARRYLELIDAHR